MNILNFKIPKKNYIVIYYIKFLNDITRVPGGGRNFDAINNICISVVSHITQVNDEGAKCLQDGKYIYTHVYYTKPVV